MSTPLKPSAAGGASPVFIALAAIFAGCVMDAVIKGLGATYSAFVISVLRFLFGGIFAFIAFRAANAQLPDMAGLRDHAMRAIASSVASVTFFHALSILALAEATVVAFAAPLMIAPLAAALLKERLRTLSVVAILVGFAGVVVTVQGEPLYSADNPRRLEGVISALTAAATYALSIVLLRQIAQRDSAHTVALLGNVFPGLFLVGPALYVGANHSGGWPPPADWPLFAMVGACGFTLWFFMTKAYAKAPAQRLAPLEYSALIWSALFGFLFFGEIPRAQVFVGATIIAAAVLFAAWDEQRAKRESLAT